MSGFRSQNTGTEQHRHHAVEVALYNLFSVLWETETGQAYRMAKANDVYSGLGAEASILSSKLDSLGGSSSNSEEVAREARELLPIVEGVDETEAADEGSGKQSSEEEPVDFDFSTTEGEQQQQQPSDKKSEPPGAPESSEPRTVGASAQREKEIAAAVLRAETIEESYSGIKVRALVAVAVCLV